MDLIDDKVKGYRAKLTAMVSQTMPQPYPPKKAKNFKASSMILDKKLIGFIFSSYSIVIHKLFACNRAKN